MHQVEDFRKQVLTIINAGIEASTPKRLFISKINVVDNFLVIDSQKFNFDKYRNIYVIGFGKISVAMALETEKILQSRISDGIIITNEEQPAKLKYIKCRKGSHPVLNENVLTASGEIIELCKKAGKDDLVICLISGGGSSLFEKLPDNISLDDYKSTVELLLKSGLNIYEVNSIRKDLSSVKGGKLLNYIHPAECINLIISDVTDDNPEVIASGPTVIPIKEKSNSYNLIERYQLENIIPYNVLNYLKSKNESDAGTKRVEIDKDYSVKNFILGNLDISLNAMIHKAKELNLNVIPLNVKLSGNINDAVRSYYEKIEAVLNDNELLSFPICFIAGGETTVTVNGKGIGGRNQEFVLRLLQMMKDVNRGFCIASCGSDGKDGNSDAAGGIADNQSLKIIMDAKLDLQSYLGNNDSNSFLKMINGEIKIKKNQTNVMDLVTVIIN